MKVKDLIDSLNRLDPSGELDVSIGGSDIDFISVMEDFTHDQLVREGSSIVSGIRKKSSRVLVIKHCDLIEEVMWENPNLPILVDIEDPKLKQDMERSVEYYREVISGEFGKTDQWLEDLELMNKFNSIS
jgi:hypothetical protein